MNKCVPTAENVRYTKVPSPPITSTMAAAAQKPHRPRIIKPKKRHNYRNLLPTYVLVPLSLETKKIAPFLTKISHHKPKKWSTSISKAPSHLRGQEAANFPPLSQNPCEKKVKAPTNQSEVAANKRESTTLTEASKQGNLEPQNDISSILSKDAKIFKPSLSVNTNFSSHSLSWNAREFIPSSSPESTITFEFDPWGNVKQCSTPELTPLYPPFDHIDTTQMDISPLGRCLRWDVTYHKSHHILACAALCFHRTLPCTQREAQSDGRSSRAIAWNIIFNIYFLKILYKRPKISIFL